MRQYPIQPPTTDSKPAPTIVMLGAPPGSSFRRRPESRGAARGEDNQPHPTTNHGQQAGPHHRHSEPPQLVIPAKAGIQRGGEWNVGNTPIQPPTPDSRPAPIVTRNPEGRHTRPPNLVIPAKAGIQRGGEGRGKTTTHRLPVISVPRYQAGIQ